ncbi:hypothetical protein CYG48_08945 [Neorhizobium sp. SOG26]|uniref:phage tail assembly chaperone n=1 Tax=Neorhizobium sp. SOG26 TaxID=2060726 RepID=UPI000E578D4B|nr:hypothetical protein [Neorhizobium sp. SOG26]AXV15811.1 hypothetical protein CYG48_08945 [Neorhizobium sp. SOG26]
MNLQKLLCAELKRQLEAKGKITTAIPAGGDLLWQWFLDLSRSRTYGAAGPNPISFAEILTYGQAMRWPMEPRHVEILRAMDAVWIERAFEKKDAQEDPKPHMVQGRTMTPAKFDAMFSGGR